VKRIYRNGWIRSTKLNVGNGCYLTTIPCIAMSTPLSQLFPGRVLLPRFPAKHPLVLNSFEYTGKGAFFTDLAFPNADKCPTLGPQSRGDPAIPLPIGHDFLLPVGNVAFRSLVAPRATVPEAAVHKKGDLLIQPAEVGGSGDLTVPPPSVRLLLSKQAHHLCLRRPVPAGPDGGHVS